VRGVYLQPARHEQTGFTERGAREDTGPELTDGPNCRSERDKQKGDSLCAISREGLQMCHSSGEERRGGKGSLQYQHLMMERWPDFGFRPCEGAHQRACPLP
jgi:hypothetical protein